MDGSLFVFAEDVLGEGLSPVLDRVSSYGLGGVTVGFAYHQARDVTPHGPYRVTLRRDGVHFPLLPGAFGELSPPVQASTPASFAASLRTATRSRGLLLHGWAVVLHNTTLGLAHPTVTSLNCFGDRGSPADLCPSNPLVREYAVALTRSVASLGVDTVVAESLHFSPFGHGYHHERCFVPLGPLAEFLFGLCFCPDCLRLAADAGVDGESARRTSAQVVGAVLSGEAPSSPSSEVTAAALASADPELLAYAMARTRTVTTLAAEVAAAVAEAGSSLVFLDAMGAYKGYGDGLPSGVPAADATWQLGVDPTALAEVVPSLALLAYAQSPERVAEDIAAYRRSLGADVDLRTVLRPGWPDTDSAETLSAKVRAALDADAVDFYAYGLNPHTALDRIPKSIQGAISG